MASVCTRRLGFELFHGHIVLRLEIAAMWFPWARARLVRMILCSCLSLDSHHITPRHIVGEGGGQGPRRLQVIGLEQEHGQGCLSLT